MASLLSTPDPGPHLDEEPADDFQHPDEISRAAMIIALMITAILACTPKTRSPRRATAARGDIPPPARGPKFALAEWAIAGAGALLLAALRWLSTFNHPWNSDEPQHLHVVWGWTAGLLPYRDFFDNHTPLFHVLFAPILGGFGERADIVEWMRLAMIPLFAFSLWCVYRLGVALFSRRAALVATLLAAFYPPFFSRMGEFRTDVLWAALWLGALVVLLTENFTPRRLFCAALILGAAFGVSMKTSLLLLTLLLAGGLTGVASWCFGPMFPEESAESPPPLWLYPAAVVAGLLVVPGAIVAFFAAHGALQPLYHCVVQHNILPGENLTHTIVRHLLSTSVLALIPGFACAAALLPSLQNDFERGLRRLFLLLTAGLFYPLLQIVWPVITMQDYLPWFPLLPIFLAPVFLWAGGKLGTKTGWWIPWFALPVLLLAVEVGGIFHERSVFARPNEKHIAALARVLQLTNPGEYVFDGKGDTIFRPRPCYLVFEGLTARQLINGTLKDDVIPRLIETRTAVVRVTARMPAEVHEFIEENYLPLEHARVLGKILPAAQDGVIGFNVTIPARYALANQDGTVSGTIDGEPLPGSCWLNAGWHELRLAQAASEVVLIWARATERGGAPFRLINRHRGT